MKGCDLSAAELKERDMKHSLFAAAILLSLLLALTIYAQKQTATKVAWEYHDGPSTIGLRLLANLTRMATKAGNSSL